MDLDITVRSNKSYADSIEAVVEATQKQGFKVQAVHDVAATLAEKGFEREPVTIVEVCNARHAYAVLAQDVRIGLMLPCPIMVYRQGDDTFIATMKPTLIAEFFPEADLADAAAAVEATVREIMAIAAA
jgi:uncharacterized protein (DUF302 family)